MNVPVVMQAPIGPATTTDLVVAVSEAGGLGTLAASWTPLGALREQVQDLQRRIDRPFCVNLVLAFDQRERLELLAELRVPVVSLSWGLDAEAIVRAHAAASVVLVQVGDVESGVRSAGAGADVVIAQGVEAGGHIQSRMPVCELVRALRRRLTIPLLAAGGIADGGAAAAVLAAGADGVAIGSAYLVASEADVHPVYRNQILDGTGAQTVVTELFDVGWPSAPHRTLRNTTVDAWQRAGSPAPGARPGEGEELGARRGRIIVRYSDAQPTRDTTGDVAAMAMYAGTGIGSASGLTDAGSLTQRLLSASRISG